MSLRSLQFLGSAVNALSMRSFSLLLGNVIALEDAGLIELLEKLPQAMVIPGWSDNCPCFWLGIST